MSTTTDPVIKAPNGYAYACYLTEAQNLAGRCYEQFGYWPDSCPLPSPWAIAGGYKLGERDGRAVMGPRTPQSAEG